MQKGMINHFGYLGKCHFDGGLGHFGEVYVESKNRVGGFNRRSYFNSRCMYGYISQRGTRSIYIPFWLVKDILSNVSGGVFDSDSLSNWATPPPGFIPTGRVVGGR